MVNGSRIRQAREVCGLNQGDLAIACDVVQSYISMVEQGANEPSDEVLARISIVTRFPVAFFKQERGPDFPLGSLLYRKTRKISSADAARVRQTGRLILEISESLFSRHPLQPLRLPQTGTGDPSQAAQVTRSTLGFSPDEPIVNLIPKLEKAGVLVSYLPLKVEGFDAFSAWSAGDPAVPVIFLNPYAPGDRIRRTCGHELGHLVQHQSFLGNVSDLDAEANDFAGEFLFPGEQMRAEVSLPMTLSKLAKLKARWGISMQAIAYDAFRRGIITARQKRYLAKKIRDAGWERTEPVSIPREYPRRLRRLAEGVAGSPIDFKRLAQEFKGPPRLLEELFGANIMQAESQRGPEEPKAGRVLSFGARQGRALKT